MTQCFSAPTRSASSRLYIGPIGLLGAAKAGSLSLTLKLETSSGKNALLRCTAAGFPPLRIDHESFAVSGPLALLASAFFPVLVNRLAASLHASSSHSVALMQLRFASFAVINLRRDLHPQECARAGRT